MPKNALWDRIKKWLSSLLIFVLLATQIVDLPTLIPGAIAAGSQSPNLVSIIVSESTNSGGIKSRIKRYAADIQANLSNTRVVIVEVPDSAAPHTIAALNEKLYYEGDGDGISKLVGTVLIGKLPIPVVHKGSKSFLSIFPYTDFDDKVFVYDTATGLYEAADTPVPRDTPEIWHGVIQPNTGTVEGDETELTEFLDKTHAFYTKSGVFAQTSAEPSVIYLDLYHDQNATKPQDFKAYNTYLKYLEDLSYNRYNKYLAKELYDTYQSFQDPLKDVDPAELKALGLEFPKVDAIDFTSTPDIQTRAAVLKSVKQFFEVFNEKYIGDILKAVNNTGRYGDGKNTRVDIAPVLVSKRDEFMKRVLKDGNTTLEWLINELVKNGLARDVLVPKTASIVDIGKGTTTADGVKKPGAPDTNPPLYQNYYFGRNANDIQTASDCTIVRGSSIPVEANRGFNISNVEGDVTTLSANAPLCFAGSTGQTGDLWGGNSPLGIKTNNLSSAEIAQLGAANSPADFVGLEERLNTEFKITGNRYTDYVRPTFDLRGQKEIKGGSPLKVASPLDCSNENLIGDPYTYTTPDEEGRPGITFYHPVSTRGTAFACVMRDSNGVVGHKTTSLKIGPLFAQVNDPAFRPTACNIYTVTLDGQAPKTVGSLCMDAATGGDSGDAGGGEYGTVHKYTYKKVPSWIEHTSPNSEEYGAALKGMVTPSLATDKDRYIDFLTPAGTVAKIEYPNLYRLKWNATETLTADMVRNRIKEVLDAKTKEISDLIARESPTKLTGGKLAEYNLLKRANYPMEWVDLYSRLAGAGNALDTIVDTVLWYNEENATSKYAFVLEHYLDSDGNSPYPLAGLKKDYEIAYIGGAWDAQNMFVKIDPEAKNPIPKSITDIQAEANSLSNLLAGANISSYSETGAEFKCGPPEWVPIWQWLPAVFCWLGTILPPTIGAGSCGNSTLGAKSAADAQFFTSQQGLDGKLDWQADRNTNGILDGYEWVKDGAIDLTASPKQLPFLSNTELKATLAKDGRILAHDSFNQVKFEVKRLILKKGQIPETLSGSTTGQAPLTSDRVVFSRGSGTESDNLELLKKYITFTPIAVRAENGESKYILGSKTKELDVILEASVSPLDKNGQPAFTKRSSELTVEIRNSGLRVTPITQTSWEPRADTSYEAGIAKSVTYNFAVTRGTGVNPEIDTTGVKRPITLTVYDDVDGKVLAGPTNIASDTYIYDGELLKQAGSYRFEFLDASGRLGISGLTILPAKPVSVNAIASSSVFVKGQKNTILVRAVDAFGNIARGNILKFSAKLSGGGYFVQNSDTKLEKSTVEWLTSFDISSNSGGQTHTLTIEVDDGSGKKLSTSLSTSSVDRAKIAVSVTDSGQLIAGGAAKKVEISVLDGNGAPLTRFNGIASLDFPKNSGRFSRQFVTIRDGKNLDAIEFTPGTLAVQNATADISIPGISEISGNSLTILPAAPMRVALTSSVAVLEARVGNQTEIQATLYDRFSNVAYNHPGGMNAQFAIPDIYAKYGTIDTTAGFNNGVARTTLKTTKKPGSLYYTVEVTPGLEANSFEVADKSGARLVIKGYSKNVALIETFYLWNADKLKNTNYSALSTTLLGADYGNVTVPNYLGGEILFAKESRSLAVTTLLSSGKLSSNLASITPAGKLTLARGSLARVDVGSSRGRTTLALYDPFRRESIGQFYLNLPSDTALIACGSGEVDTLNDCPASTTDNSIFLRGIGKTEVKRGATLSLTMDGVSVLDITPRWEIRKYPSIELTADGKETKNFLSLLVTSNGVAIGRIGVKMSGKSIVRSLATEIGSALENNQGSIIYEASSPRYAASSTYLGNSSYGAQWLTISQREDAPKWADRDLIGSSSKLGLEQYTDKKAIGFGDGNNTLLEFAGQSSVGESTRAAATYSQIVLGDPVARLPELMSNQNYDRTLGKRLADGDGGIIETSIPGDYNNDGQEDILVFYDTGKVELLQNFGGTYRSLGYVIYVVDAGPERKWAGNFSGTGYSSIVMTDTKWQLIVIENQQGKFVRVPTRITFPEWTPAKISGSIMQLEIFDMDRDGKLDLVISDDSGELNILYGSVDSTGLYFTKKTLDTNIGLKLWSGSLSQGGALRWTGIREVSNQTSQTDYARESQNAATDESGLSLADQKRLLDSKIYYTQATTRIASSPAAARSERLTRALGDDPNTPGTPNAALAAEVQANITTLQGLAASGSINTNALDNTTIADRATYLRSEFGSGEDLIVARSFIDRNGGTLQAGDRIGVSIAITNRGSTERRDFQYLDSFDKTVFHPSENTKYTIKNGATITGSGSLKSLTDGEFDYQFGGFSIPPGETATIEYELVANAVRYGKFKVGILETDDELGDVSMNANAVCGDDETLYKSVDPRPRSYIKTLKSVIPLEDPSGSKDGKFTDFNGNKQPDYIDLLSGEGGSNEIRSSLWDSTTQGILIFREAPKNGIIDGKSFQIGRIILDKSKGYIQSNPVSLAGDIPALPGADLTVLKTERPNTIHSGNIPTDLPPACGKAEDITGLRIEGFEQEFKMSELADLTGVFKFAAIGMDKATGKECSISITENSNPTSDGKTVTGVGWKLLTKSTFAHYGLAGTQADIINSAAGIPDTEELRGADTISLSANGGIQGTIDLSGMSSANIDSINSGIDTIVQWLGCGFGGGSCLALPMNWAPLAPGSAPVIMGTPISPLRVDTGRPVFSALTCRPQTIACGKNTCSIGVPSMYPMSDYNLDGATLVPGANNPAACTGGTKNAAGGSLGVNSVSNFFRFFVTPTLTGAVGVAACYGGPARAIGNIPPKWISPVVPGGNCIVAAAPLSGCTDDGSDGNIADLGTLDTSGTINAAACRTPGAGAGRDQYPLLGASEQQAIAQYVRSGGANASFVSNILQNAAGRGGFKVPSGPLISIWGGGGGSAFELSIDPATIKNFDRGAIERITHERVSAFPDFIMDWVNRQLEEVSNKLTSLPTLYIIKPDFRGALDDGFTGFSDKLQSSFAAGSNNGSSVLGNAEAGRTISGVKAAYEFMSRIPLIKFEPTTLNITYPDIGKEDLNKIQKEYEATRAQWQKEINDKKKLYATLGTREGLDTSVVVEAEALVSGIDGNIRMIESYKKFPDQLAKYLTWKERYAKQLLCNITAIQAMLDGFISSNAQRFKAWVEFGEMLKNILKGWQLIPDLFYKYDAECGVCRNERHDAKQFKFKLISSIIPPLPIIKFPKWPDIILDLHNVRMGLRIAIPEFSFTPTPIVLPTLPKLQLPTLPRVGFILPGIPTLPALPPLPELPNLPSLPTITLPELPPPPTVPKLFGSIKFTLNILKIVAKVMCLMRSNPFVPEWRAGDQIAQITERQGKLGIDFLNIEFPQFNASFVDAIKVTTFVNFEFQIDFLIEMARATFEPISNFTANMSSVVSNPAGGIPGNIDLRGTNPGNININVGGPTSMNDSAKSLARAFVATIHSGQNAANSNASFTDLRDLLELELAALVTPIGSEESALIESMRTGLAYRADDQVRDLQNQLSSDNAAKFWLATSFVESEIAETEMLRAAIESGSRSNISLAEILNQETQLQKSSNHLWASGGEPAILTASLGGATTESPLPDFSRANGQLEQAFVALSNAPAVDPALEAEAAHLKSRVERLSGALASRWALYAADTTENFVNELGGIVDSAASTSNGQSSGGTESSAAQNVYRGIYSFDNARQIRLFDYTDELSSDARAIQVNRLGNGAKEYIYIVSGALYLKTRLGNSPLRPSTDSISTLSITDVLGAATTPSAPNHFREQFAKSGEIQFDFAPASSNDSFWALRLYDYVDRYARTRGGESLPQITPRTTVTRVDLVPDMSKELSEDLSRTGLIVKKPFGVYSSGRGEGLMTGSEYRILESGQKIRIGAGKSIFSDGGGSRIGYKFADIEWASSSNQTAGIITLGESRELRFERTMDIEVLSGNILLETPNLSAIPRTVDLSSLKGYPILVGSKIAFDRVGTRLDMVYHNGMRSQLNSPSTYEAYALGSKSKRYSVAISHPNGWEYASLTAVSPKNPTRTEIRLLSPQIQADREGPLFSLTSPLRAPVYLSNRINLGESISDNSGIRDLFVDEDLSLDSNGDGKKDNDPDSRSGTGVIRSGSGTLELIISPQKTLFERRIKLWATDEAGNISSRESKVVIYSPIPTITTQSGAIITGQLDERLEQERVDLVRFRSGKIDPIGETLRTTSGAFSGTLQTGSGLILRENGTPLANINERSGVVSLTGTGLNLRVTGASEASPTTISIVRGTSTLYSQALALSAQSKIETVSSLADARSRLSSGSGSAGGAGVRLANGYTLVKNTSNTTTLPGGVFVTGIDRKGVFGMSKDGNIYLMSAGLSMSYATEEWVLVLRVLSPSGETIADIYYLMEAEFVIK